MSIAWPRAGRIAVLGTSLVQQNHIGGDAFVATAARGWMSWADVLSYGRLACPVHHDPRVVPGWEPSNRTGASRFFNGLNFGVGGQKAVEIERRLGRVLEGDFDLVIVDAGTNDMMVETKEAIAGLRARIAKRLLDAGKIVILLPILARGSQKWSAGGPERAKAHWINRMSQDFAERHANCHVFDWNAPWVDPASDIGGPRDGYSNDGTHFSVTGAFAVGKALAAYLQHLLPHAPDRLVARDDRYDGINNPLGNLVAPARQAMTADGNASLSLADDVTEVPVGTWLQAVCDIAVPATTGLCGLTMRLVDNNSDGFTTLALAPFRDENGHHYPYPHEAWSGTLRTPPLRIRPGGNPPSLWLDLISPVPVSIEVSKLELRPMLSPVHS